METFFAWAGGIASVLAIAGALFAILHKFSTIIANQEMHSERHNELCEKTDKLQDDIAELRKSEAKITTIWEFVMRGAATRLFDHGLMERGEEE